MDIILFVLVVVGVMAGVLGVLLAVVWAPIGVYTATKWLVNSRMGRRSALRVFVITPAKSAGRYSRRERWEYVETIWVRMPR